MPDLWTCIGVTSPPRKWRQEGRPDGEPAALVQAWRPQPREVQGGLHQVPRRALSGLLFTRNAGRATEQYARRSQSARCPWGSSESFGAQNPSWSPLGSGKHRPETSSRVESLKMTYTSMFKASKFIAVHFRIAFTMEILIVQIVILDFVAFERSQRFFIFCNHFRRSVSLHLLLKIKQIILYLDTI